VSVLLPAYNAERFVDAAVQSVVGQTFTDWEVVAVDDASRDGTHQRLLDWAARDARIRVARNERNLGMTGNWNACLARAAGDLVIKLDADDAFRPRTLELLVEALADTEVIGAGVRTLLCSEDLEPVDGMPADDAMTRQGLDPYKDQDYPCAAWYAFAALGEQLWHSCAVMVRRETLVARHGYEERLGCASDSELVWYLLEQPARFAHRGYVGVLYRTVAGSVSDQFRARNWLTWEGTAANLLSLHRYRQGRPLSRALRMYYVQSWERWQRFRVSPEAAALPADVRGKLEGLTAEVKPPPLWDRFVWSARQWLHRLHV
jgi:glycosyltransferase involved in cell wall biosynthesis